MTATRRLAAILATDVAGDSRLTSADEEGTLERLKAHRRALIWEFRGTLYLTSRSGDKYCVPEIVVFT